VKKTRKHKKKELKTTAKRNRKKTALKDRLSIQHVGMYKAALRGKRLNGPEKRAYIGSVYFYLFTASLLP
jgi:hypothetical protein